MRLITLSGKNYSQDLKAGSQTRTLTTALTIPTASVYIWLHSSQEGQLLISRPHFCGLWAMGLIAYPVAAEPEPKCLSDARPYYHDTHWVIPMAFASRTRGRGWWCLPTLCTRQHSMLSIPSFTSSLSFLP